MDNEIKRCTGHCCEMFFLPFTPRQLKKLKKLKRKKRMHPYLKGNHVINSRHNYEDMDTIMNMVIPISPSREKLNSHIGESASKNGNWYTCKNFDKETRNCKIYNTRPRMCRDFPYGILSEIDKTKCYYKSCHGCQNEDSSNYNSIDEYVNSSNQNVESENVPPICEVN